MLVNAIPVLNTFILIVSINRMDHLCCGHVCFDAFCYIIKLPHKHTYSLMCEEKFYGKCNECLILYVYHPISDYCSKVTSISISVLSSILSYMYIVQKADNLRATIRSTFSISRMTSVLIRTDMCVDVVASYWSASEGWKTNETWWWIWFFSPRFALILSRF